jgi:hypothetical protein
MSYHEHFEFEMKYFFESQFRPFTRKQQNPEKNGVVKL